jgi:hypothetical protein
VYGNVNGRRGSVERLADHEDGFAVGIAACAEEGYIRGEGNVSGNLLPDEMEVVDAEPHILAAAAYGVGVPGAVILRGTGVEHRANVLVILKDSQLPGLGLQSKGNKREGGENSQLAN